MHEEFQPDERLYRKIRPLEQFWDSESQRPTSGAFKDRNGLKDRIALASSKARKLSQLVRIDQFPIQDE